MLTHDEKLAWLRKHEYEVDMKEENDEDEFWEAWDTLDYDGYHVVCATKEEAIDEAYNFLSEEGTINAE